MSFDFKRRPLKDSASYAFPRVSLDPEKPLTLHTRPLTMKNAAFMNAAIKRRREAPLEYADSVQQDIDDLAEFCVVGWDNCTEDGQAVDVTPAKVRELLLQIYADYPEEVEFFRFWAKKHDNFAAVAEAAGKV